MGFIDLILNYIIGTFFGFMSLMATMAFFIHKEDRANIRDLGLVNIVLHYVYVIVVIIVFGFQTGTNTSTGPLFSPYWGAIPFQALHYIIWAIIAYRMSIKQNQKKKKK